MPPPAADRSPPTADTPLSIERINAAFAQMLGQPAPDQPQLQRQGIAGAEAEALRAAGVPAAPTAPDPCEISPRTIAEAVLFVGSPDGGWRTAEELAALMRGVSPAEVRQAIAELNNHYDRDAAPYAIECSASGYRLSLRPEMHRMRDKFHGRIKEFRLTPDALEVLAVVAYQQPVDAAEVDRLRGKASGGLLATLVRRGLVRLSRAAGPTHRDASEVSSRAPAVYRTTDRFLRVFSLADPEQLPRVAEIDG